MRHAIQIKLGGGARALSAAGQPRLSRGQRALAEHFAKRDREEAKVDPKFVLVDADAFGRELGRIFPDAPRTFVGESYSTIHLNDTGSFNEGRQEISVAAISHILVGWAFMRLAALNTPVLRVSVHPINGRWMTCVHGDQDQWSAGEPDGTDRLAACLLRALRIAKEASR